LTSLYPITAGKRRYRIASFPAIKIQQLFVWMGLPQLRDKHQFQAAAAAAAAAVATAVGSAC